MVVYLSLHSPALPTTNMYADFYVLNAILIKGTVGKM
jgi:hypothetical protein